MGKNLEVMKYSVEVSIIIVNYNTKELLRNCINSIIKETEDVTYEIIVSDNGSNDGSVEMIELEYTNVILVKNGNNLGFGAANNKGREKAHGKYVFFLNSDTLLLNNAIKFFYDYWENSLEKENIGALGTILLDENLRKIHSGGNFPTYDDILAESKRIYKRHIKGFFVKFFNLSWLLALKGKIKKIQEVDDVKYGCIDYVTGADLFMLNNMDAVFDEAFFLYYEETDLQLRISKKNKKRILIEGPKIMHLVNKQNNKKYQVTSFSTIQCQISELRYVKKNLGNDTSELFSIIMKDWKNPFIYKIAKKNIKTLRMIIEK